MNVYAVLDGSPTIYAVVSAETLQSAAQEASEIARAMLTAGTADEALIAVQP